MSLLDDQTPIIIPTMSSRDDRARVEQLADRARLLSDARVAALDAASRVHSGQSTYARNVLNTADTFLRWLLAPESDAVDLDKAT